MWKPLTSFGDKRTNFDAITSEINSRNTMKEIEDVIESKRKEIFDILSDSRADWNEDADEISLKWMVDALNTKKSALEDHLWDVTPDFNILSDNTDLLKYCKNILGPADPSKADDVLAWECGGLLTNLQEVYTKWKKTENLFTGRKDNASEPYTDLIKPDVFSDIINATDATKLQESIDKFVEKTFDKKDNAFGIAKTHLYRKPQEQAKVASRTAIFLHCMKKALSEWRLSGAKKAKVKSILTKLKEEQIPKIRWLYNLKKEKDAVDAEYETLVDIRKNDKIDINWTDTTTDINLTDAFESKSTGKAKKIDFYNLSKQDIKLNISGTEYTKDDIILKDSSWEKTELNIDSGNPSGDFDLYVKISWNEVKIWKVNLDYTDQAKASFTLVQDPDATKNLTAAVWTTITWDINLSIPIMAVKKVSARNTWQVSLTRNIVAKISAWGPTPIPIPVPTEDLEIDATISDMWKDVLREKVAHNIEEELRKEYKGIAKWNVFKRAYFFLARWQIRNKRIKKQLDSMSWKAFTWDTTIDTHTQNAADRHELEKLNWLDADIKNIDETSAVVYQSAEINDLCKNYLQSWWTTPMSDADFQTKFNEILERDANLKDELNKANVTHMWTNILLKMKQKCARKDLIAQVSNNFEEYDRTKSNVYLDNINIAIENYIKQYQDSSKELMTVYNDFLWDKNDKDKLDKLKQYLDHQKSVMALTTNNIKIKLDIVKGWKSAYQIDNKDREKSWKYKLWHWMDKHPVWTTVWTVWASIWLWALTWWLWAVAGAIVTTAWFAGIVWTTNAVKKWTHHTKEQNTHEKDLVTDHANEMRKVQEWIDTVNNWKWWKKYKAKRQLKLYNETTQSKIAITNIIADEITNRSSKIWVLSSEDEKKLKYFLIEWRARLKYYREIWHNFLASNDKSKTEEDMNKLEKSIYLWINKLWETDPSVIEWYSWENDFSQTKSFKDIYDAIKDDFETTDKVFRKRRRRLSTTYWVCTGLLSGATAIGMQYITHTWVFAKPTPGTPAYSSTNTLTDNFELWKHELLDTWVQNNIYNNTQSAVTSAPSWSTINIHYWAWTDATWFINTPPTAADLATKVSTVNSNISSMPWLSAADKATFMAEVSGLWWWTWTNGVLQNMRQAEFLEQAARALSDSWQSWNVTVSLIHDTWLDVVWTHTHDIWERVVNWMIEVTKAEGPEQPAKTWWRWLMGMPTFFNTFKDRKAA